jgi:hypothetical protein
MEEQLCKNYEKCPIFNGILGGKEATIKSYKKTYCTNPSPTGWVTCKRYIVKERIGKVPPELLPNSNKSIEEIINSMN